MTTAINTNNFPGPADALHPEGLDFVWMENHDQAHRCGLVDQVRRADCGMATYRLYNTRGNPDSPYYSVFGPYAIVCTRHGEWSIRTDRLEASAALCHDIICSECVWGRRP
jgi:hypothetical protein